MTAVSTKDFHNIHEEIITFLPEDRDYWSFIDYIASQAEIREYKSLTDTIAKKLFLYKFWLRRGPEVFNEYIERVKYADEHFSHLREKGRYTDMGRIYIKYGKPDQEMKLPQEGPYMPCVRWQYFTGGLFFIFVDRMNTGKYELMYTNANGENVNPNWQRYINPQALE